MGLPLGGEGSPIGGEREREKGAKDSMGISKSRR